MAEYEFGIIGVEPSFKEQSVFIYFNLDLDPDTIDHKNIYLVYLDKKLNANKAVNYNLITHGDFIQLKLDDWAVPNDEYTLLIQPGISSITGVNLDSALIRNFSFKTDVTSKIKILSPSNYQKISNNFTCKWKEIGDTLENNFYLEIDKNNLFNLNPIKTTISSKKKFSTKIKENGQYYLRIRSIKGDEYGYWSDIVTFLIDNKSNNDSDDNDEDSSDDDMLIIDNEEIKILSFPDNGITPSKSFDFVFDEDIDTTDMNIKIIRSDI